MAEQERLRIVVGIDGFETGRRALDWALREALIRDCALHVVHAWVVDPMADFFTETSSQRVYEESLAMLRGEVEQATSGMTELPKSSRTAFRVIPAGFCPNRRVVQRCWSSAGIGVGWSGRCYWARSARHAYATPVARSSSFQRSCHSPRKAVRPSRLRLLLVAKPHAFGPTRQPRHQPVPAG